MVQLNLKYSDLMNPGHLGCPGCGATIAMKFALQALGDKTMVVIPACCWGVIAGPYPQSALNIPVLQTAFATAGAAASGLRAIASLGSFGPRVSSAMDSDRRNNGSALSYSFCSR